jgi:hypothetical protein
MDPMPVPEEQKAVSVELEVVKPENQNDPRYFYLKNPIDVDGREIRYLMLDPDLGGLRGRDHFQIGVTYARKFPDEISRQTTPWQKYLSENYLSLVIAKLNKIAPEDLFKVPFKDRSKLFMQAATFQFSEEPTTTPPE